MVVPLSFGAGALSLDGLGRGTSGVSVAGVIAIALAAGLDDLPGASLPGMGPAELTWVSVAGVVAVALAAGADSSAGASLLCMGPGVSLAGVVAVVLAAGLDDLPGTALLGTEAAEPRRVSDFRVGSFQDFSFVSLLYQYFLPLTSYSFHGWLAGAASAFAPGFSIGVAACGAAVAAHFGAGRFVAGATCAVGSFHNFSLVFLLYQYFFPILKCQILDFGELKSHYLSVDSTV